jgi:hypothetical protein
MRRARGGLLLATLMLASCASIDVVNPKAPLDSLPDRAAAIRPGLDDRSAVRGLLGTPLFASSRLRFDLFREGTTQTLVPVVLTPWPVPFGRMKDELLRYTLVTYDDAGRAAALASGIFRRPSEFRRTAPIDDEVSALHLRVGELMFFVDPEGERRERMLVAPAGRDAWLRDAADPTACTVVVGCGDRGCSDRLAVDDGPERRLPLRATQLYWLKEETRAAWMAGTSASGTEPLAWLETLVAIRLAPGEHALRFSSRHYDGDHRAALGCHSGEVAYLRVHARAEEGGFKRRLVDWRVERLASMPDAFARRPLVVLHDGEWFVDAGPDE